jgi:hypothetical protein
MTQAPEAPARTRAQIPGRTSRADPWWKTPRIVAVGLTIWAAYATAHVSAGHHFLKHPVRYWLWTRVSWLNARHLQFAWITLGTLMLSDLYILLLASGAFPDPRIFN